ncbi:MAG TPA: FecR domain-containing protein [Bacteroidales bacterium]
MKEKEENIDWKLITKYLGRELDEKEKEEFMQWKSASDKNDKEVSNAERIWDLSYSKGSEVFNTDSAWTKMENRIHVPSIGKVAKERRLTTQIMRIAASFLILVTIGIAAYWFVGKRDYVKIIAENHKILTPIILPDGTKVYLNKGASLKYPKVFDKAFRDVELTGEAFFEVTHNENQPFVIQTPRAKVKVLGTSFNVAAYQNSDSVQVVVETGTVELSPKTGNEKIRLTKGNTGVYYANDHKLLKSAESDVNTTSWKTNIIIFKNVDLLYVTKVLSRVFSQSFSFENDKLKKCRVNSDFKDANLDNIIKTISIINKVDIKKANNGYVITGPGC